jgi:glycosyltransferase involved in cell wall biosynthesis
MINISFAITVCNEAYELDRLLGKLTECTIDGDEVVVQIDESNTTPEVLQVISKFENDSNYSLIKVVSNLNKDFATFKNNLKNNCTKDYIYFIDADEEVNETQIDVTRQVIELNPQVECYLVPRINTVEGLTQEHINKWGWRVDEKQRINFPDYQYRLCVNKPEIVWVGAVHEKLNGYANMALLPAEDEYALEHHKHIKKQELQNNFYDTI